MNPRIRMMIYGVLAAVGAIGTWMYNARFARENGSFDILVWVKSGFSSSPSASLAVDFYVSMTAGIIFVVAEARRIRMKRVWIYLALLAVAWATALPIFLLARERHLLARRSGG